MSRVDFVVDGEKVEDAHPYHHDDVRISLDGGETFPLRTDRYEHIVVEVETRPDVKRDE